MADWTEAEARAYLPRLRLLLAVLRQAAGSAARVRSNGHGALGGAAPPGGSAEADAGDEAAGIDPQSALAELDERGIVLRDIERGLVDFPSRHPGGRPVLLCWQSGEDDIGWWHLPEDGFAGRRPLPLPPEL